MYSTVHARFERAVELSRAVDAIALRRPSTVDRLHAPREDAIHAHVILSFASSTTETRVPIA